MKANRTHGNNIDALLKTPLAVVQIETIDSPLKSPPLMTLKSFHYRAPCIVYHTVAPVTEIPCHGNESWKVPAKTRRGMGSLSV